MKATVSKVYELPVGMKLHYAPLLVQQTWREWAMSGRKEIPDIRQVATQDSAARNDVWTWDYIVRFLVDSQATEDDRKRRMQNGGQDEPPPDIPLSPLPFV